MFVWTKQLSVGNRILDSNHKNLLGIIQEISRSIAAGDVAASARGLEQLENCLYAYFAVEEYIAKAINFDFTQHKRAHQSLLNELRCIKGELTAEKGLRSDGDEANYARILMDYLMHHIKEESRPLKIVLDTHYYDLNP